MRPIHPVKKTAVEVEFADLCLKQIDEDWIHRDQTEKIEMLKYTVVDLLIRYMENARYHQIEGA